MQRPALIADSLGKSYQIGLKNGPLPTFREALLSTMRASLHRIRSLGVNGNAEQTFWALRDVSFEIQPGEVVGLIGRNGAGKSTLLKILSRITTPTEGTARLRGRVASLLEVGTGFHPELTGRENIYLNGSILGMKRAEIDRRFDEIVEFAEIAQFLETPVKRYSSGMFVRLAFAVAAHLDPEILIVDEVLAVGDAAFQRKCLGKMQSVSASGGRTVLFVSHNLTTVRSLCSRAIWLKNGNVNRDGPVGPVVEAYLSNILGEGRDSFDLDDIDRPSGQSTLVRLNRITINGGAPIRHGLPLQVELDYEVLADVGGVAFGIGLSSLEGCRIMSSDSDIPGPRLELSKGTRGRLHLTIPELQIQPGRYFLDVGARSSENKSLDYLPACAQVEVLPGPSTPIVLIGRDVSGGVRVPADCQHSVLDPGLSTSHELIKETRA
jgi:lipopolysaccharide transport system ATP-binding protein